jgi:serine/threonine-protein kinase
MKRCPQCRRDYLDDTLLYCLDDGSALLEGPASADEPATAIMSAASAANPSQEKWTSLPGRSPTSIAVLPFAHLSSDPDDEYFCDGLAEELLNALSRVDGLRVAARTSSFFYKGKNVQLGEIGRELGVAAVLEGSVRKAGDRLRITVQLINIADGYHLWSERYDRKMSDIFEVQDDITMSVVTALKVRLLEKDRAPMLKKPTLNSEAFDLYLRARAFWNKRTIDGFERAIDHLEQAIALDKNYALAYAALADCYSFMAYFEWFLPAEMEPKAKLAVEKALELDPGLAECHTAMATFKLFFEFDFDAAGRNYQAAIDINPNFSQAHYLFCSTLAATGRFDEALSEGQIAVGLDPLSPPANMTFARVLCYTQRCEEAIDRIEKCFEIAPELWFLHWMLGVAYRRTGELTRSIEHFQKSARTGGLRVYSYLGDALIKAGRLDEARKLLDELRAIPAASYVSPIAEAIIEAELGDIPRGLDLLEEAWKLRVIHLMWARVDHVFDVFREEPRFKELLKEMNLGDTQL